MNEDFLENDIDGDVGGYLAKSKRQRRQPNAAGTHLRVCPPIYLYMCVHAYICV